MKFTRRYVLGSTLGALATLTFAAALPSFAQSEKLTKLILPFAAGSGVDVITRASSKSLAAALGGAVVIDNQPGAGGIVGTSALVKSAPDGATLSVVSNNHVIYPSVHKSLQSNRYRRKYARPRRLPRAHVERPRRCSRFAATANAARGPSQCLRVQIALPR